MHVSIPPPRILWPGVPSPGTRLIELARELGDGMRVEGDELVRVYGIRQDSRRIEDGEIFYARKGQHADGTRFARDAVRRGARAILAGEGEVSASELGVPVLVARDPATAFARVADAIYGHPSFSLEIVGVTGTNGKTTVTHLVRDAIDGALGAPHCGLVGTVGHSFADFSLPSEHTTPEADEIARALAAFRHRGATHAAMEVSSIALALGRVRAVRMRVAVFTNLTQDHLDFHGDMESYAAAKALLFDAYGPGAAVVNVDDPFGATLAGRVRAPCLRVSTRLDATVAEADVAPTRVVFDEGGITADVRTPAGAVTLTSRLVGAHNLQNLLVALAVAVALELDVPRAAAALSSARGAPGRLERCDGPDDDVRVLVDYAHSPDAIEKVILAVRPFTRGRVLAIFGCGGDRDPHKRAPMGAAASAAEVVVVTSDNPRSEDPAAIAAQAEAGVVGAGKVRLDVDALATATSGYVVLVDRAEAIDRAVRAARPGDTVLVLGKGHETYQVLGDRTRPFDDRIEARRALDARRGERR